MGKKTLRVITAAWAVLLLTTSAAFAATNPSLNQTINAGALATDILDASRVAVASPSVTMSAKNFSFDCQADANSSTGTLGSNTERIYVTNPSGANNGWTLTIAATSGASSRWANGDSSSFIDFNDTAGSTAGCSDGADADATAGQMTIDPSVGTLSTDCVTCSASNISKGSSASFNQGTVDTLTLLNAAASSDDVWRGYLTGVDVKQTIPGETPADTFTINLTLTATAS